MIAIHNQRGFFKSHEEEINDIISLERNEEVLRGEGAGHWGTLIGVALALVIGVVVVSLFTMTKDTTEGSITAAFGALSDTIKGNAP